MRADNCLLAAPKPKDAEGCRGLGGSGSNSIWLVTEVTVIPCEMCAYVPPVCRVCVILAEGISKQKQTSYRQDEC